MDLDQILKDARASDSEQSTFDYIIVGSGAGGGPLAARLAEAGKKVLVIEAGGDPITAKSDTYPNAEPGEVTRIPGYHGAATEDAELSWMFSVRHYAADKVQPKDEKYAPERVERIAMVSKSEITTKAGVFAESTYSFSSATRLVDDTGETVDASALKPGVRITVDAGNEGADRPLRTIKVWREKSKPDERSVIGPNSPP